ncbi:MAG: permease [Chthoniobacterales bacterium]
MLSTPSFQFSLPDFQYAFLSILLEGIPFLLGGAILSGILEEFLPRTLMTRLLPRNPRSAVLVSGLLGVILPVCECGIVPVVRRLLKKGLPVSCGVTYMLAAPIVNPLVLLSTLAAFRGQAAWEMTSLRFALGLSVAVLAGWITGMVAPFEILRPGILGPGGDDDEGHHRHHSGSGGGFPDRLRNAADVAVRDFLDVFVFFALGAAAASLFSTAVNQEIILPLASNLPLSIASLMGLATVLSVCSTTDAFIAATFTTFPMAAKLAFLVFGPMVDFKLLFLYGAAFSKRFVLFLSIGLFLVIGLLCWRLGTLQLGW